MNKIRNDNEEVFMGIDPATGMDCLSVCVINADGSKTNLTWSQYRELHSEDFCPTGCLCGRPCMMPPLHGVVCCCDICARQY